MVSTNEHGMLDDFASLETPVDLFPESIGCESLARVRRNAFTARRRDPSQVEKLRNDEGGDDVPVRNVRSGNAVPIEPG